MSTPGGGGESLTNQKPVLIVLTNHRPDCITCCQTEDPACVQREPEPGGQLELCRSLSVLEVKMTR